MQFLTIIFTYLFIMHILPSSIIIFLFPETYPITITNEKQKDFKASFFQKLHKNICSDSKIILF